MLNGDKYFYGQLPSYVELWKLFNPRLTPVMTILESFLLIVDALNLAVYGSNS